MKNSSLILFLSCLCLFFTSILSSQKKRSHKSFRSSNKIRSQTKVKQSFPYRLNFNIHAYLTSNLIASRNQYVWVCVKSGSTVKFYSNPNYSAALSGTAPTDCSALAVNSVGELYVVAGKKLFLLARQQTQTTPNSYIWKEIAKIEDAQDVSVDNSDNAYYINTSGEIYTLAGKALGSRFAAKKSYGKNCKLEGSSDKGETVYVVNEKRELIKVSNSNTETVIFTEVGVDDLCIDKNTNLYFASDEGIYMKRPDTLPILATYDKSLSLGCGDSIWSIGLDNYIYSGVIAS